MFSNIKRALEVSTAHITKGDAEQLEEMAKPDNKGAPIIVANWFEYGWIVYALHPREDYSSFSPAMYRILELARVKGCDYVWFDCDGATHEQLPKFDW